jgi:metallophosphoesterase (TIGR00282 family)
MTCLTVAFLGDIFGTPGRQVVQQQLPVLREDHKPDVVIANAENARRGSGLSPEIYRKLRGYGIDAITLGDHVYRDAKITEVLQAADEPIARPANLAAAAVGRSVTRIPPRPGHAKSVFVITVLGRVFFPLPADDPFATVDRLLEGLPEADPIVIVEAHMEATSEKTALAHHLDGRVAAVLGTHTHVPTADARILKGGTAFITDVGMCGPYESVIGRERGAVIHHMTTGMYAPFNVGTGGEAMCGAVIRVDEGSCRALEIQRIQYAARHDLPPFAGA